MNNEKICPKCNSIIEGETPSKLFFIVYICDKCGYSIDEFGNEGVKHVF